MDLNRPITPLQKTLILSAVLAVLVWVIVGNWALERHEANEGTAQDADITIAGERR